MKPIKKKMQNDLGIKGHYYVWWNDNFELSKETKILVCHDGQVLFSTSKNPLGKNLTVKIDKIIENKRLNMLVIGIESSVSEKRMLLLSPFFPDIEWLKKDKSVNRKEFIDQKPLGDHYLKFVKEIVDNVLNQYHLNENEKFLMGASMGGYITVYASLLPDFSSFKKFICLSTALWFNEEKMIKAIKNIKGKKYFFGVGTNENPDEPARPYLKNTDKLKDTLRNNNEVDWLLLKGGVHNENSWTEIIERNITMFH